MEEHCVKVYLKLSEGYGTVEERNAIRKLSKILEHSIQLCDAGELDGDEFGGGRCVLWMYGPDADRLFEAIRDVLAANALARGGYAVKRYGAPKEGVRKETIEL